jgi:GMP synthase (glutamine-hydrolysing)
MKFKSRASLGIDPELLGHPFPGPGLSIRILGDITLEKVQILQDVDKVFIDGLKSWGLIKYGKQEQFYYQLIV